MPDTNALRKRNSPVIIVHGGAWAIPKHLTDATLKGVRTAAALAHDLLLSGGSASDAVQTAITCLEDNPCFDAGIGSCLTSEGKVEMDAAIMTDGRAGPRAGAVACVTEVQNPIKLASHVLSSPHVLLVGAGADAFAREKGLQLAEGNTLITDSARAEHEAYNQYGNVVDALFNSHDTVGAAALDMYGILACGTSTGGITRKRPGRVGDSPVVGSGLYCERGVGACSTTGHGESIMKMVLARGIIARAEMRAERKCLKKRDAEDVKVGGELGSVITIELEKMRRRTGGCGGAIMVGADGSLGWGCTTERMAWASVGMDGASQCGIDAGVVLE